jgi:hypothetical protein
VFARSETNGLSLSQNDFMTIQLAASETDDPGFIELLNSLVKGLLADQTPEELWIVRIDNWFDHKWLGFSGMGAIASDFPIAGYETVKAGSYQEKVTFPPFTPNRIVGQWSFMRQGDDYTEAPLPALPHDMERKPSEMNLRRRIQDFARSACFVWYSGNTLANGRGSVMVYNIAADQVGCWFAAFHRELAWKLHATKGASRGDVQKLIGPAFALLTPET